MSQPMAQPLSNPTYGQQMPYGSPPVHMMNDPSGQQMQQPYGHNNTNDPSTVQIIDPTTMLPPSSNPPSPPAPSVPDLPTNPAAPWYKLGQKPGLHFWAKSGPSLQWTFIILFSILILAAPLWLIFRAAPNFDVTYGRTGSMDLCLTQVLDWSINGFLNMTPLILIEFVLALFLWGSMGLFLTPYAALSKRFPGNDGGRVKPWGVVQKLDNWCGIVEDVMLVFIPIDFSTQSSSGNQNLSAISNNTAGNRDLENGGNTTPNAQNGPHQNNHSSKEDSPNSEASEFENLHVNTASTTTTIRNGNIDRNGTNSNVHDSRPWTSERLIYLAMRIIIWFVSSLFIIHAYRQIQRIGYDFISLYEMLMRYFLVLVPSWILALGLWVKAEMSWVGYGYEKGDNLSM